MRFVQTNVVNYIDLIESYGIENLFHRHIFTMFPNSGYSSFAEWVLDPRFISDDATQSPYDESQRTYLKQIGCALLSRPTPWVSDQQLDHLDLDYIYDEGGKILLEPDELFGVFSLLANLLEADNLHLVNTSLINNFKKIKNPFVEPVRWILLARFKRIAKAKVQAQVDEGGFSPEQQAFIWRWMRKEIDLVEKVTPDLTEEQTTDMNGT